MKLKLDTVLKVLGVCVLAIMPGGFVMMAGYLWYRSKFRSKGNKKHHNGTIRSRISDSAQRTQKKEKENE